MSHPKKESPPGIAMWGVIVSFALIIGLIYFLEVSMTTEPSPPIIPDASSERPTPQQTQQTLNSLKATATTSVTQAQQQKTVNSLKATGNLSQNTKTSPDQTNKILDSLKAH